MRVGVVGTGMIAKMVVPQFGAWGFDVAAVCGTPDTLDEVHALADPYGAACYGAYEEMLADGAVDTVYIAVPNHLHHPFALKALEAGKHAIVEKPFAVNAVKAEEMAAAARERGLFIFEAASTRYLPNFQRIRELLPHVGTIKMVCCNYSQYSSRYDAFRAGTVLPAFDPARAGGAIMDLGLYNFQYLIGLFGAPESVTYQANIERGIDTSGVAVLDYGAFKAVNVCAKDCAAPTMNVIQGDAGYILQDTPANACGEVVLHLNDGTEERYNDNPALPWESEFRTFAAAIDGDDRERCERELACTLAVSRALTDARATAGIRFPQDGE